MLARIARLSFAPILLSAVGLFALPGLAGAYGTGAVLHPGVYDGKWHGDKVKIIVETVCRDGTFSGIVHFDQASNWPDARFDFAGRIGPGESLTITRIKDNCGQVSRAGPPCTEGRMLVWRGETAEGNLDRPYPFELTIPIGR